jgi:integrase
MLTVMAEAYIALKQSLGYRFCDAAAVLRSYVRFASERGDTHVRTDSIVAWAGTVSSPRQRYRRFRTCLPFSRYAHAEDPRHEIPPDDLFIFRYRRPVPFIFRPEQLRELIAGASCLGRAGSPLRPETYTTVFALLACTGLRVSEALALKLDDWTADGLAVRDTKFGKSRLVPLHESTVVALERYLDQRQRLAPCHDHFFLGHDGLPLRYSAVWRIFRRLVRELGMHPGPGSPAPKLHSLRHTFAVRALESCPSGAERVGKHLVALSTYLGHDTVSATYWYLEATPQLMTDIATASAAWLGRQSS